MQYGNQTTAPLADRTLWRMIYRDQLQRQVQQGDPEQRRIQPGAEVIEVSPLPRPGPMEFYLHDAAD